MRHPICLWHQDRNAVYITLDHPHMHLDSARVEEGTLYLSGCGTDGETYEAALALRRLVTDCSVQTSSRSCPRIVLRKAGAGPPATVTITDKHDNSSEENEEEDELSELSEEGEESEVWDGLLTPGCRNRFVKPDWSRWGANCEDVSGIGEVDINALQNMLAQTC